MTLAWMVRNSLRQHALSTSVTALSIALASGLLMAVWVVKDQSASAFTGFSGGFDAVLGARGSKLQLVLNAIFHLEESPGNISWQDYLDVRKNPNVELAVPLALGDNFRGYRVVGTLPDLFEKSEYASGAKFRVQPGGRMFDPNLREVLVGSLAAERLKLRPGDRIRPYHGLNFDEKKQHDEIYLVVGLLEPSNTPADRVLWIPLEGVQKMSGHDPKAASEISGVLVKIKSGAASAGFLLDLMYNKQGNRLTFAWPIGRVMAQLFDKIGWFDKVLALVAYLVAVVAAASILASLYSSMNERRREVAILRALGARRGTIFSAIMLESAAIAGIGAVAGFLVYYVILAGAAAVIRAQVGVILSPNSPHPVMIWAPVVMVLMGAAAGIIPAAKAYKTDVAENLMPHS